MVRSKNNKEEQAPETNSSNASSASPSSRSVTSDSSSSSVTKRKVLSPEEEQKKAKSHRAMDTREAEAEIAAQKAILEKMQDLHTGDINQQEEDDLLKGESDSDGDLASNYWKYRDGDKKDKDEKSLADHTDTDPTIPTQQVITAQQDPPPPKALFHVLKVAKGRKIEELLDEDGKMSVAIFPTAYPRDVINDATKLEINRVITNQYKARMSVDTDVWIDIESSKIISGIVTIATSNARSADWIAFVINDNNKHRPAGSRLEVRALKEVNVAPSFALWIPDADDSFDLAKRILNQSNAALNTDDWTMTKEYQKNNHGKRWIFVASQQLLTLMKDQTMIYLVYGPSFFKANIRSLNGKRAPVGKQRKFL